MPCSATTEKSCRHDETARVCTCILTPDGLIDVIWHVDIHYDDMSQSTSTACVVGTRLRGLCNEKKSCFSAVMRLDTQACYC